jgi:hypothetical protein
MTTKADRSPAWWIAVNREQAKTVTPDWTSEQGSRPVRAQQDGSEFVLRSDTHELVDPWVARAQEAATTDG